MRISDWSSDVRSSDLLSAGELIGHAQGFYGRCQRDEREIIQQKESDGSWGRALRSRHGIVLLLGAYPSVQAIRVPHLPATPSRQWKSAAPGPGKVPVDSSRGRVDRA